jgi:hypothetical protein
MSYKQVICIRLASLSAPENSWVYISVTSEVL